MFSTLPWGLLLLLIPQCLSTKINTPDQAAFFKEVLSKTASQQYCKPSGLIQDACCDFETIESVNQNLSLQLHELIQRDYFKYWKVDLSRECPFWKEDGSCMNRACAVEELQEDHIPAKWRMSSLSQVEPLDESSAKPLEDQEESCYFRDSDFCRVEDVQLPSPNDQSFYVDLTDNPERFTGYAGPSASKVWQAIYGENCFGTRIQQFEATRGIEAGGSGYAHVPPGSPFGGLLSSIAGPKDEGEEECLEKRVYYRLISGLHASISIHICDEYLDQTTGLWAPNLDCFVSRIGEHPERLQNVYFDYVVFLRALAKAAPFLRDYDVCSGDQVEDERTKAALAKLLDTATACESTFDEKSLFTGPESHVLKEEFKSHFRNISRIMDCVGCDKCRLWGGLQVTGFGTALKLLFEAPECGDVCHLDLKRSEVVAFINTLNRLSESLAAIEKFRKLWFQRQKQVKKAAKKAAPKARPAPPVSKGDAALRKAKPPRVPPPMPPRHRKVPPTFAPQQKAKNVFAPQASDPPVQAAELLRQMIEAGRTSLWRYLWDLAGKAGLAPAPLGEHPEL